MYDTYGLDPETISELAKIERLSFDKNDFYEELNSVKQRSKSSHDNGGDIISQESIWTLETNKIPTTDDTVKYDYAAIDNNYQFKTVNCKLLGMIVNGEWKIDFFNNVRKNFKLFRRR